MMGSEKAKKSHLTSTTYTTCSMHKRAFLAPKNWRRVVVTFDHPKRKLRTAFRDSSGDGDGGTSDEDWRKGCCYKRAFAIVVVVVAKKSSDVHHTNRGWTSSDPPPTVRLVWYASRLFFGTTDCDEKGLLLAAAFSSADDYILLVLLYLVLQGTAARFSQT